MDNNTEVIDCEPFFHMGYVRSDRRIKEKMNIYEARSQRGDFYQGFSAKRWLEDVWWKHRTEPRTQVHPIPDAYPSHVRTYEGHIPQSMWFHPYTWLPGLVSIIVVTHNSKAVLSDLLSSWIAHPPGVQCEWIIIDNQSKPEHRDQLLGLNGQRFGGMPLQVIFNEHNLMFTRAVNQGIARSRGEYFLLLNPDIVILKTNWLLQMLQDMSAIPGAVICGNKHLYPDGTIQHAGGTYAFCQKTGEWGPEHLGCEVHTRQGDTDNGQFDTRTEAEWVTGACMLIHRRAYIALGELDAISYPHYGSDRIYCEEAKRAGFRVIYSPVPVVHKHGMSSEQKGEE